MEINHNCKLAKHITNFYFDCSYNCPRRINPDISGKLKGLICAYQLNTCLKGILPTKQLITQKGTEIRHIAGVRQYWSYKLKKWVTSKYQDERRNINF